MKAVYIVCFFTAVIHLMESLALSMRLAGVRTKQIATSISFVNVTFLIARMSNMFQAPLLGAMVDLAIKTNSAEQLINNFRLIILAACVGNLLGMFLTPTMVNIFVEGIKIFEKKGSIPKLIFTALRPKNILKMVRSFRMPRVSMLQDMRFSALPKGFLYLNVFMVGVYAVGVLAALLAGAFLPEHRATAVQLSGIVNGMATIVLAIAVDPTGAFITDQTVKGKRPEADVRTMVFSLLLGRVVATFILAQILLVPSAKYIMTVATYIVNHFGG
jgi:hypothetical protein